MIEYDKLTPRQKELINLVETIEYTPNEYCKRTGDIDVIDLGYTNMEGNLIYIKTYHYKLYANGNIITETQPFKREVYKIK